MHTKKFYVYIGPIINVSVMSGRIPGLHHYLGYALAVASVLRVSNGDIVPCSKTQCRFEPVTLW